MITYGSTTLTSYNSIVKTEVYYYKSTSATSLSGGSWSTTKPTWENGKYIWQKIRTVYEDGTHSESDPVNITGQQGATGTAAYSFKLNSSDSIIGKTKDGEYTIKKITFSATYKQGTGAVSAYNGRFKIESTTNGSTWKTEYTSSGNESSKAFTIPNDIIAIKCSLYQSGGTTVLLDIVTVPVVKDGVDAIGLRDSIPYYLASDKDTGITRLTHGWTRYRPQLTAEKKYLWVYYVSRYSEGTTEPELIEIKDDVVHFVNNGDESPVESCVVDIEPVQDLNGYDHPWVGGAGKNLFDIDSAVDGYIVGNGSTIASPDANNMTSDFIPVVAGQTYTYTCTPTSTASPWTGYAFYSAKDMSTVVGTRVVVNALSATFTVPNGANYLRIGSRNLKNGNAQVEKGSVATAWTPYSNICPITGWTGAKVTRTGKNLLPNTAVTSTVQGVTYTVNPDGSVSANGTSTGWRGLKISEFTLGAGQYKLTSGVIPAQQYYSYFSLLNGSVEIANTNTGGAKSFTISEDITLTCKLFSRPGAVLNNVMNYPMILLESDADTTYAPFVGYDICDITFPSESGTVYGGQLNVTTGELIVDRAMVTLDGSNNESIVNTSEENANTGVWNGYKSIGTAEATFISDKLKSKAPQTSTAATGLWEVWCSALAPRMWFSVPKTLTTYAELRAYLAENPITVVYPLATPITYTLTPQEITMLCKENNIFADTGQTTISYYDNQTSTDPYVDYSLTSAFDASTDALDKAKEVAQDLVDLGADLQAQIDGKIETWCQKTDPSTAWTTTELKNQHNGDLWYYTGESTSTYKNNTTYKYTASTNKWTAYSASTDLFDKIDTKASIYYGKPSAVTQNLEVGDYLVDSTDGCSYRWDGSKWVKLTDYNAAIDAIEIGGKNLLRGTKTQDTTLGNYRQNVTATEETLFGCTVFTSSDRWADIGFDFKKQILNRDLVKAGDSVTYSIWAKTDDTEPRNIHGVWVGSYYSGTTIAVLSSEWTQYSKTFIVTEEMLEATSAIMTRFECNTDCTEGKYIYWAAPKLERGTKATDWTPAPEDTEAEFSALQEDLQAQIDGKVETWCQSTDPSTAWTTADLKNQHDGDLWYYTGESTSSYKNNTTYKYTASTNKWTAYSANTDLFDKIDNKTAIYYGEPTTVTSAEEGDYLVDATDGSSYRWNSGAWVKVSDYKSAIDAIEVGGRNLLKWTANPKANGTYYKKNPEETDGWYAWNSSVGAITETDNGIKFTHNSSTTPAGIVIPLVSLNAAIGEIEYVLSFKYRTNLTSIGSPYLLCQADGNISYGQAISIIQSETEWKYFNYKIQWSSSSGRNTWAILLPYINISDGWIEIQNSSMKLEKGTKATDWTPAPEDVDASISTAQTTADEALAATQPISSKTFTNIIGTANDIANASFYFAKVHPTTYTDPWMVKMKIKASVPTGTNFRKTIDISIHGCRSNFISYDSMVANYNSNPIYYINLYRATQEGIETNHKGHALGFGLRSSVTPTDPEKARTFEVDLLEVDGCAVDWIDTPVKYADMDGTGSTNYVGCTELGITSNGQNATNNDNTYDRVKYSTIKAAEAIARYNIIVGTSAGYKHLKSGTPWDITYPILYADAALNANATGASNYLTIPFTVTTTQNMTLTPYKPVYIEGTLEGTTFTPIDTTPLTQTIPTADNGHHYILLGSAYSTTAINLEAEHPIYQFQNGNFVTVAEAASRIGANAENLIKATYAVCSTAAGTNAKTADCTNFELYKGVRIQVTFTNANTAEAPTLNIHNTGAKAIYINKTVTSDTNLLLWTAGSKMEFVYDGTGWIAQNVPYALYGTCSTGASTATKAVTCNEAVICKGTTISVNMTNTNTAANATMNVGSTVAKDIYANGAKLTTNSRFNWRANTTQKFVFDGQVWRMDDDSVKALATAYITEIDDDGIMVHPEDDSTSGWAISDAIQLFKNGISYIKLWIENNIPKIRIGKEDQGHIILDNDSVDIRNDNKVLASFGATSVIGDENDWHQTIAANQITFAKGNNTITYISPDKLYTINAEVADAFYISNYSIRNASDGKLVIGLRR